MKQTYDTPTIIKVSPPKKKDIRTIRLLICCGLVVMSLFIFWFLKPEHLGFGPIYVLLTVALLFKLVKMLHEWYHYWSLSVPERPVLKTRYTVDVLTTACPGEPRDMIIRTLHAMAAIRYPHTNYLCDEGDDPVLKKVCEELGIVHVTRIEKKNAKAGNINNALKQATGDICIILDPDHIPVPEFIDRVLPYFEDPEIGFVQCVQAYGNQSESIIARGAAEQTYHFYGPMMMCMNSYGTVQAIGANCSFRRKALDSIGGHAAGLSEDMHTAMQLHAKGWKSVYIPEVLSRGLVPATLSAYYKQQLKWSRGTFELLFRTYPQLYKNFTWRQKIHYFTIPLYFLFGLINLIDILVPMLALILAAVPWEVEIRNFAVLFIPLCAISMMIRIFAQRWLLEKHEQGLHLAGGILRTATWWIFLVGFIYSIFKIKVPYIPTPKEDQHQNYWLLSIPNFITAVLCAAAIYYGLMIDWSPYSIAMASYAFINAAMLFYVVMMSQQKFLIGLKKWMRSFALYKEVLLGYNLVSARMQHSFLAILKSGPVALLLGVALVSLSYSTIDEDENIASPHREKIFGGFYAGITMTGNNTAEVLSRTKELDLEIISFYDTLKVKEDPTHFLRDFTNEGHIIPMLRWIIPGDIRDKKYKAVLEEYVASFRKYRQPVFIAPEFIGHDDRSLKESWQYLYTFFNDLGISNLTWVWNASNSKTHGKDSYPGTKFVDWVGVSCLNYGENKYDNDWYSFAQIYTPYREAIGMYQKPVIITEMGCFSGPHQDDWFRSAFDEIKNNLKEVRSVVIFNGKKEFIISADNKTINYTADFSMSGNNTAGVIASRLREEPFAEDPLLSHELSYLANDSVEYRSPFVKGSPGHYTLLSDGKEFYIRGVAYNTAHDWRDGNMPLTRRQVEKDFQNIREMGANTLRRYDPGIYDRNVLNIAGEYDLKVQYGFWFDPKVDYYRDTNRVKEYISSVEEKVLEFKDHPSVLAWSLGNETWGLLKHRYSKPYLTKVREHYIKMIELLAQRIHQLDPSRPVFTSIEHEEYQLPGELVAFHDAAPSIDVIGINSYYQQQLRKLNHTCFQFDPDRPYMISEFGPRGYWDPNYNHTLKGSIIEETEQEKAAWYQFQWKNYVSAFKGYNIGGFAYCWHDRMEGSFTWFGLSDYKGRLKPSYFALKEQWTGEKDELMPAFRIAAPQEMEPGKTYVFTALSETSNSTLEYEWYLLKDEFLDRIDNIKPIENGRKVFVKIPEIPSHYRLYLFVSDGKDRTTTASVPVLVE
jgi:cellulose synthase/poly-beta-1,6-N-acetylglucosamine synthase-like glycosyltransferase